MADVRRVVTIAIVLAVARASTRRRSSTPAATAIP